MVFDQECLKIRDTVKREICEAKITEEQKMLFFRNIKPPQAFQDDDVSGDYSLQLQMGYHNWKAWNTPTQSLFYRTKLMVPLLFREAEEAKITAAKREPLRAVGTPLDPEDE